MVLVIFFLNIDYGQVFIVIGDNFIMVCLMGIWIDWMMIVGLMIFNGMVGLGGVLIVQFNGYVDINMGIGIIVIVLVLIIIGEVVFGELMLG